MTKPLDLVIANYGVATISVLLGNGNGTFQARTTYATGVNPYSIGVGDVNGDGIPDIVSADKNDQSINVFLGNGNGTFQARTTFAGTGKVYNNCLALADLNGDGFLDIAAGDSTNYCVTVLLGNGNGTFQAAHTFGVGGRLYALNAADINGDGKPDLVCLSPAAVSSYAVTTLLSNGNGTFQARQTFALSQYSLGMAVADINGDGKPDIVTSYLSSAGIGALLGNGNGTFQAEKLTAGVVSNPVQVAVADFNTDGKLDVAVCVNNPTDLEIFLGNGNGTFQAPTTFSDGGDTGGAIISADFDGDGKADLALTNQTTNIVGIWLGNGNGTFHTRATFAAGNLPNTMVTERLTQLVPLLVKASEGTTVADFLGASLPTTLHIAVTDHSTVVDFPGVGGLVPYLISVTEFVGATDLPLLAGPALPRSRFGLAGFDGRQTILPPRPFDGQRFIDASLQTWVYDAEDNAWDNIGQADAVPLATAVSRGFLSPQDKQFIDSLIYPGGGFSIITKPSSLIAKPVQGLVGGDITLRSNSLDIACTTNTNAGGSPTDQVLINIGDLPAPNGIPMGLGISLNNVFKGLLTFCPAVQPGQPGDVGPKGRNGNYATTFTPVGDQGPNGVSTTVPCTFTGVVDETVDGIFDTAIVDAQINSSCELVLTSGQLNVPTDGPNQLLCSPLARAISWPDGVSTLDQWSITQPPEDSTPLDLSLLRLPNDGDCAKPLPFTGYQLSQLATDIVGYYLGVLNQWDETWRLQIKQYVEGIDSAAQQILDGISNQLFNCKSQDTSNCPPLNSGTATSTLPPTTHPPPPTTRRPTTTTTTTPSPPIFTTSTTTTLPPFTTSTTTTTTTTTTTKAPPVASSVVCALSETSVKNEGTDFAVSVLDQYSNVFTGYNGTLKFGITDPLGTVQPTGKPTDGAGRFSCTFNTCGTWEISVTDSVNSSLTTTCTTSVFSPAARFIVTLPGTVQSGSEFSFPVEAVDEENQPVSTYSGTLHFTTSDNAGTVPPDTHVSPTPLGTYAFDATLVTVGVQTITVTDEECQITGTGTTHVTSSIIPTAIRITMPPGYTTNQPQNFTACVIDQFGNPVTTYSGMVTFTSTDGIAILPGPSTLVSGCGTFPATFKTCGLQTLFGDDVPNSLHGSAQTQVNTLARRFAITGASLVTTGQSFPITIRALDQNSNVDNTFNGQAQLTSTDQYALMPGTVTFVSGSVVANVTLYRLANTTITATNSLCGLTGQQIFGVLGFPTLCCGHSPVFPALLLANVVGNNACAFGSGGGITVPLLSNQGPGPGGSYFMSVLFAGFQNGYLDGWAYNWPAGGLDQGLPAGQFGVLLTCEGNPPGSDCFTPTIYVLCGDSVCPPGFNTITNNGNCMVLTNNVNPPFQNGTPCVCNNQISINFVSVDGNTLTVLVTSP